MSFPPFVQFETTIVCNANCSYCAQREIKGRPAFMSQDMILDIIEQCRTQPVTAILPFLSGEPMLVPRIDDIVSTIKTYTSAQAHLFSNCSLLDSQKATALLQAGLDRLVVTIDGATEETYSRTKRGLSFATVVRNVEQFLILRNELRANCSVRIQFTRTQDNRNLREWPRFQRYWLDRIDPSLDEVVLGWEVDWVGRELRSYQRKLPCFYTIESSCYILSNGDVVPCCLDHLAQNVVGNILDQSIEDIWSGKEMNRFRQMRQTAGIAHLLPCRHCRVGLPEARLVKTFRRFVGLGRGSWVRLLDKASMIVQSHHE